MLGLILYQDGIPLKNNISESNLENWAVHICKAALLFLFTCHVYVLLYGLLLMNVFFLRYGIVLHFDDRQTPNTLRDMRESAWIDQGTRYVVIDFSLINHDAHIISAYRIIVDFKRSKSQGF